jgi:phosphoglycolate phosphatase/pyrophosphatase PpaX
MTTNYLFDLDGTLGNTLPLCIAAFREALEPLAKRPLSDGEIMATFGPTEEGTVSALAPEHVDEGVARYLEAYARLQDRWPEPFAGIRELLLSLKRGHDFVGLVTGKGPRSLSITLRRYGLEGLFDAVKTGDPAGPVKDRCIAELLSEHALDRAATVYVGDTAYDIRASRACGIRVVAAAWAPTADAEKLRAWGPDALFTTVDAFAAAVCAGRI